MKEEIEKCFTEMPNEYLPVDEKDANIDIESIVEKVQNRSDVELTDQFWSILKGNSN